MAAAKSKERDEARVALLATWANDQGVDLARLDLGQQLIIFTALELIAFLGAVTPLKSSVAFASEVIERPVTSQASRHRGEVSFR